MDINIFRLRPLVKEMKGIREALTRLADLYELDLQKNSGLITRSVVASKQELADTMVDATDPDYLAIVERMEHDAGRQLTDEESLRVLEVLRDERS